MRQTQKPLAFGYTNPGSNTEMKIQDPLTQTAMLVTLTIAIPGMTKKDQDVTDSVHAQYNTAFNAGGYVKRKYGSLYTRPITSIATAARSYHRSVTMPWRGGDRLLPSKLYMEYTAKMGDFKIDFLRARDEFKAVWSDICTEAQNRLGSMYNANDYPDFYSLDYEFVFNIDVNPISKGCHLDLVDLVTDELDILRDRIDEYNQKNLEKATQDLWFRLYEVVEAMQLKMTDEDAKIYRQSILTNITDLLSLLGDLNIAQDPQLEKLALDVQSKLCVYDINDIKGDKHLRADLAQEADDIMNEMIGHIGFKPKTKNVGTTKNV